MSTGRSGWLSTWKRRSKNLRTSIDNTYDISIDWVTDLVITFLALLVFTLAVIRIGQNGQLGVDFEQLLLGIGAIAAAFFVFVKSRQLRLSNRQRDYKDLIERERTALEGYSDITKNAEIDTASTDESTSFEALREETILHLKVAEVELEEAKRAVCRRDYVSFFRSFYGANSKRVYAYTVMDWMESGPKATRTRNLALWVLQASSRLPNPDKTEITNYLTEEKGDKRREREADDDPDPHALYRAIMTLQGHDVKNLEQLITVRRYMRLTIPLLLFTTLGLIAALGSGGILDAAASDATTGSALVLEWWFAPFIGGVGVLGALFFMAVSAQDAMHSVTSATSIPDPTILREAFAIRVLVGAVSALLVVTFVVSDASSAIFTTSFRSNELAMLLLAFLAGYSERFVGEALKKTERKIIGPDELPEPEEAMQGADTSDERVWK